MSTPAESLTVGRSAAEQIERGLTTALTFDDVLLVPQHSPVLPSAVDVSSRFTRNIRLNIPLVSAAMDTVTESRLAIALAQEGGIGVIHRNLPIEDQADEVDKVKRSESGMIVDPVTIRPTSRISDALELMKQYHISGVPDHRRRGRPPRRHPHQPRPPLREPTSTGRSPSVMTRENLVTVPVGTTLERGARTSCTATASRSCWSSTRTAPERPHHGQGHPEDDGVPERLQGRARPPARRRRHRRRRRLARARPRRWSRAQASTCSSSTPRTATRSGVLDTVRGSSSSFPNVQLVAGNVATAEAARRADRAGADGVKVGIGPGSICTTRDRLRRRRAADHRDRRMRTRRGCEPDVPVIADGGIKYSGDITKAIAAGADSVMIGSLFAGTDESPGETILYQGRTFKAYRGMGSLGAMARGQPRPLLPGRATAADAGKLVPEGIEGRVPYKGRLSDHGLPAGRRPARRHGLLRLPHHRGSADQGAGSSASPPPACAKATSTTSSSPRKRRTTAASSRDGAGAVAGRAADANDSGVVRRLSDGQPRAATAAATSPRRRCPPARR